MRQKLLDGQCNVAADVRSGLLYLNETDDMRGMNYTIGVKMMASREFLLLSFLYVHNVIIPRRCQRPNGIGYIGIPHTRKTLLFLRRNRARIPLASLVRVEDHGSRQVQ